MFSHDRVSYARRRSLGHELLGLSLELIGPSQHAVKPLLVLVVLARRLLGFVGGLANWILPFCGTLDVGLALTLGCRLGLPLLLVGGRTFLTLVACALDLLLCEETNWSAMPGAD